MRNLFTDLLATQHSHTPLTVRTIARRRSGPLATAVAFTAAAMIAVFSGPAAFAGVYYWDNDGSAAGFGTAAGTWAAPTTGSATQGWSLDTAGTTLPVDYTTLTTDTINFGNGATGLAAGTITVSGTVGSGSMTFASGSGAIVLSGGTINLAAATTITVDNSSDTISSTLSGVGSSLTKAGTGTLTLSNTANNFSGGLTLNANSGTVIAASSAANKAIGSGAVTVGNGSTLQINTTTNVASTIANTFNAGTGLVKLNIAAGTTAVGTTMSGLGSFTGTLELANTGSNKDKLSGAITASTTALVIDSGSTLYVNGAQTFGSISVTGTGNAENLGAIRLGAFTLNGNITLAGSTTIGGGGGTVTGTITSGVAGTQTLTLSAGNTFSQAIGGGIGTIALINSAGTNVLSGANTYTGATTVQGSGTLTITGTGSINPATGAALTLGASSSKGIFQYNSSAASNFGAIIVGNGTSSGGSTLNQTAGTINGSSLTLNSGYTGSGTGIVALSGGTMTISGTTTISNSTANDNVLSTFTISGASTIFNTSGDLRLTGQPGTGRFADGKFVQTDGMVTVAGTNGLLLVQGVSGNAATRRGQYDLNGGTLNVNTITSSSTAATDAVAIFNFNGGTLKPTVSSPTFWANNAQTTANVQNGGAKIDTAGFDITIAQALVHFATATTDSLTKSGTGTLKLSGTNTYTGTTAITTGTLQATTAAALPNYGTASKVTVAGTATLAVNYGGASDWTSVQVDSLLTNNGAGFATGSFLGFDTTNLSGSYGTSITVANLGLTKLGNNTLTLGGTNSYTGGTTISAGTLSLGSSSAVGSSGTISMNGGTLQFSASNTTDYSTRLKIEDGKTANFDTNGQDVIFANALSVGTLGTGGLIKAYNSAGTGSLTLSGANTYTGVTTVNQGILYLNHTGDSNPAIKGNVTIAAFKNSSYNYSGVLELKADNQLESTATVTMDISGTNGIGNSFVLGGHSQTIRFRINAAQHKYQ